MTRMVAGADEPEKPAGAKGFYLVAVLSLVVSIDTSWRFFGDVLNITNGWERAVMFTVLEVALLACGYGMRANVQRTGRPGAPRLVAWVLCGLAGYMAWQLSGVAAGVARVALGPVLGLVMLHLALGIEIRTRAHAATTWVRIGRELRERAVSRLGLSDDSRDALARTRDRAARRAARLSQARRVLFRTTRLSQAVTKSNAAHDPAMRARMLAELAAIRHAADLITLEQPSPWRDGLAADAFTGQPPHTGPDRSLNAEVSGSARSLNGTPGRSVNGATPGVDSDSVPANERPRRGRTGRAAVRKPPARRPLSYYLAQTRDKVTPGVAVTPAWVREVIPDCPHSTSKNVADALNTEARDNTAPAQRDRPSGASRLSHPVPDNPVPNERREL